MMESPMPFTTICNLCYSARSQSAIFKNKNQSDLKLPDNLLKFIDNLLVVHNSIHDFLKLAAGLVCMEMVSAKVEAFFVPAGTVVEMYGTTLHYAPCNDGEEGFKCIVILPKGTNTEIDFALPKSGEDALMTAKNKWLIAHEEAAIKGAFNGLRGENISL